MGKRTKKRRGLAAWLDRRDLRPVRLIPMSNKAVLFVADSAQVNMMTRRRALSLAMMALEHVAQVDPSVREWIQARDTVRELLQQTRASEARGAGSRADTPQGTGTS